MKKTNEGTKPSTKKILMAVTLYEVDTTYQPSDYNKHKTAELAMFTDGNMVKVATLEGEGTIPLAKLAQKHAQTFAALAANLVTQCRIGCDEALRKTSASCPLS